MKQRFLARMRTALDEIEQNAPTDLALFEYVDLLTAQTPRPPSLCTGRGWVRVAGRSERKSPCFQHLFFASPYGGSSTTN